MNPLNHVAIIMDGNGRWGIKYKNSRNAGHRAGLDTVEKIIKETLKQKIKFLTLYAFSTENWKRPKKEINYLFNLLETFLTDKVDNLHKQNIKLKIIGVKNFSKNLNKLLVSAESAAVTIAGTPADDDLTYFTIYRDVSDSNDDMAGDARLHGIKLFFTTDAANDA